MAGAETIPARAGSRLKGLSSPNGHPLWGHLPALSGDGPAFLTMCAREHGDLVPLRLVNVRALLVGNPAHVEAMLVAHNAKLVKPPVFNRNRLLFGRSLLVSDGEPWLRQRRLVQPAFAHQRLNAAAPGIIAAAETAQAGWRDGESRDIHRDMVRLTLATLSRALFGIEAIDEIELMTAAWREIAEALSTRFKTYEAIPEWLPTPANRRLRHGVTQIEGVSAG